MEKINNIIKLWGPIIGALATVAKFLYNYFTNVPASNELAVGLIMAFIFFSVLFMVFFISERLKPNEDLIKRLEAIEKRLALDYEGKEWSLAQKENNVFFILRDETNRNSDLITKNYKDEIELLKDEIKSINIMMDDKIYGYDKTKVFTAVKEKIFKKPILLLDFTIVERLDLLESLFLPMKRKQ